MTIQTSIPDLVFSSALPDVVVNANASEVAIELWDEDEPLYFYSCNLFSFQKQVTVRNLASIIEEYMEKQQFSTLSVILRVSSPEGEDSVGFFVVYCSQIVEENATSFLASHFLTGASSKVTYDGCHERLSYVTPKNEEFFEKWTFVLQNPDGNTFVAGLTLEKFIASGPGLHGIDASVAAVRALIASDYPTASVLSYIITVGTRSMRYFVHEGSPSVKLGFFNMFNIPEYLAIHGVTTEKTEVSRSSAVCNHVTTYYDRSVERTYEVETGPLSASQAEWIDQLILSHDVRFIDPKNPNLYSSPRVLIGDHTCEISDTDEELNIIKFSWQFAEDRPHYRHGISLVAEGAAASGTRIFTSEFNSVFS